MSLLALGLMLENRFNYEIVDGNFFHDPFRQLSEVIERNGRAILGPIPSRSIRTTCLPTCAAAAAR